MRRRLISKQTALWFVLLALLLIINTFVTYVNLKTVVADEQSVAHTHEVIEQLALLISALKDAETGQRGYLLTGEAAYLEPYSEAIGLIQSQIIRLKDLTADNPQQQQRMPTLDQQVQAKLAELKQSIDLRASQGFDAARQLVLTGKGKQEMDAIRTLVAEMTADEQSLLTVRMAESAASIQTARLSFGIATLVALGLLIGIYYLINRELAARQRAAEEIRVQREWFEVTLSSIGDAVIATDTRGCVTFMNKVAETLTGWPLDEANGRDLADVFRIVNEYTREAVESPVTKVLREGTVAGLANHTLLIAKDDTLRAIDDSGAPIRSRDGTLIGVVLVFRDIGQQKRADDAQTLLAEASAVLAGSLDYDTTLASMAELIVPQLGDVCVVFLVAEDGSLRRVAGTHQDRAKAEQLLELQRSPIDLVGPHPAAEVIRTGKSAFNPQISAATLHTVTHDPERTDTLRALIPAAQMIVPLVARQRIIGALSIGADGSARSYDMADLALAEELGRRVALAVDNALLYRAAQDAIRLRDIFLSVASHELKTPLTTLLGQAQLLQRRALREQTMSARDQGTVRIVVDQALRLNRMISALLDISRLEQGQLSIERQRLDFGTFVRQIVDEIQPTLTKHTIVYAAPDAPLLIDGDALRLEQALQNLIGNAVKYMPAGGPVYVRVERRSLNVCVAVADQGIGIPDDALPQLFQRFYRASNADVRHISGMGVGLYVVKEIVGLHGGGVTVESVEGQGSTFTICLPLAEQSRTV